MQNYLKLQMFQRAEYKRQEHEESIGKEFVPREYVEPNVEKEAIEVEYDLEVWLS